MEIDIYLIMHLEFLISTNNLDHEDQETLLFFSCDFY